MLVGTLSDDRRRQVLSLVVLIVFCDLYVSVHAIGVKTVARLFRATKTQLHRVEEKIIHLIFGHNLCKIM